MATYYVDLPTDYLHLLNCICIYNVKKTYKCYNAGDTWRAAATRLTADAYSQVLDNFWTKPSYKRPYYYIHNINISETIPTNPYNDGEGTDRDKIIDAYKPIKKWNNNTILGIISEYSDDLEDGGYYLYNNPALDVDDNIVSVNKSAASGNELSPYPVVEDENLIKRYFQVSTGEIYKLNKLENGSTYYYKWFIESFDLDRSGNIIVNNSDKDMFSSINLSDLGKVSNIERASQVRYGNASKVRLEIRYGTDNSVFTLDEIPGKKGGKIYIDYIKSPQHIRLTQEEIDYTEDKSQVLEFPDYVCQEILNELVHLIMENISDQRLQTHPVVSQSIANPTQAQAPEAAGQSAQQ